MEKHLQALKNEAKIIEALKSYDYEDKDLIKKLIDNIDVERYDLDNTWKLKKAFYRVMDAEDFDRDLKILIGDYLDARSYFELIKNSLNTTAGVGIYSSTLYLPINLLHIGTL